VIFDARNNCLRTIAKAIRLTAAEFGAAHVYVAGWMVTVRHDFDARPSYAGVYDFRATEDHVMRDLCGLLAEGERK
jgi:hypothetical protein